jgi:hypothetical protein
LQRGFCRSFETLQCFSSRSGISVTNLSVNPARSTGPAIFCGGFALEQLWVFWVAPLVGAALAGGVYPLVAGTGERWALFRRPRLRQRPACCAMSAFVNSSPNSSVDCGSCPVTSSRSCSTWLVKGMKLCEYFAPESKRRARDPPHPAHRVKPCASRGSNDSNGLTGPSSCVPLWSLGPLLALSADYFATFLTSVAVVQ